MKKAADCKILTVIRYAFIVAAVAVLVYFIAGSLLLAQREKPENGRFGTISGGWTLLRSDGTQIQINLPGKVKAERNEFLVLQNTLPENVSDNLYLCIRSSKQEMKIYIDGVLRQEYSTKETRPWGRVSAVTWIFVPLCNEDAGKEIRVENVTETSYSGQFYQVYYGEKWEIWLEFFKESGAELIIGMFMLVLGIATIIISIALKYSYEKDIELLYLGIGVFMAAIWVLANSVFRQIIFPSLSVISDMAFFMVMLMGIPFMLYLNDVQKQRHWKAYCIIIGAVLVNGAVCTVLHIMSCVDFSDTIGCLGILDALSIVFMVYSIVQDVRKKKLKEYRLVALGIAALCVVAITELVLYFCLPNYFNGSVIAIGLVIMLVISFINTMKEVLNLEKDKQKAVMASEAKGKFLSNMSHEIRTPINAVLGMDAMILRESEEEHIREYAMNIQNAGQTLLSLVNDILDFSKIESGKMEIIPVEYDFSSMIHDVVNMIKIKAADKGLEMKVFVDSSMPFCLFGDEVRIRQILINLLTNAVKYTQEGCITLRVRAEKGKETVRVFFDVEDTGIGIKEEDIGKLFARFERIEEERNRNIEGTGLGMSITLQLLKLMDGELMVESEYGKGSRFSFVLEQKIIDEEPIGDLQERIKKMPSEFQYAASFTAPEARILVVDDNLMNRKVFSSLLKQTRCLIEEAESGPECLELVQNNKYDIIFLDHMMPGMDGVETLRRMKKLQEYPCKETPVVALTANAISGAREMYLQEGFDEFLSKPVQPEKLEIMIMHLLPEHMLQVSGQISQEESGVGALENLPEIEGIDYRSAAVYLPDKEIFLESVRDFYRTIDTDARQLEEFYETLEENLDNYRIKVHAMKGSAALIGAVKLSEQAKELEFAAKEENMKLIYRNTEIFLKQWCSYKEKLSIFAIETEKEKIEDISGISEQLLKLKDAMEYMDVDTADAIMKELSRYTYPDEISAHMDTLATAVVNLDYNGVFEIVDKILKEI